MGFQEELDREKKILLSSKRPYETAAFVIFAILFLQQFIALIVRLYQFATGTWFNNNGTTTPGFFARILAFDTTSWMYVILAFAALAFWYFLIYVFVWRYCKRHGYAKWTWTVLVVFGPLIFFTPAYIIYAAYVFRPYLFRFLKTIIVEFQEFDPHKLAEHEAKIDEEIEKSLNEDALNKKERESEKAKLAAEKDELKNQEEVDTDQT